MRLVRLTHSRTMRCLIATGAVHGVTLLLLGNLANVAEFGTHSYPNYGITNEIVP